MKFCHKFWGHLWRNEFSSLIFVTNNPKPCSVCSLLFLGFAGLGDGRMLMLPSMEEVIRPGQWGGLVGMEICTGRATEPTQQR